MAVRLYYRKRTHFSFTEEFTAKVKARALQRKKARLVRQKVMASRRAKHNAAITKPGPEARTAGPKPTKIDATEAPAEPFVFPCRCFYPPPPKAKHAPTANPARLSTPPPSQPESDVESPGRWRVFSPSATLVRDLSVWLDYHETWPPTLDLRDDSDLSEDEDEADAQVLAQMMQVQCQMRGGESDEEWD